MIVIRYVGLLTSIMCINQSCNILTPIAQDRSKETLFIMIETDIIDIKHSYDPAKFFEDYISTRCPVKLRHEHVGDDITGELLLSSLMNSSSTYLSVPDG
jgi:hypothetical protein